MFKIIFFLHNSVRLMPREIYFLVECLFCTVLLCLSNLQSIAENTSLTILTANINKKRTAHLFPGLLTRLQKAGGVGVNVPAVVLLRCCNVALASGWKHFVTWHRWDILVMRISGHIELQVRRGPCEICLLENRIDINNAFELT